MQTGLLLVVVLKSLAELGAMFIVGQGVLYVLAARNRDGNFFYQLFRVITRPLYAAARFLAPRIVLDRHIPYVALILLLWIWLASVWQLNEMCRSGDYDCSGMIERKRGE